MSGQRRDKHRLAGPAEAAGPAAGWRRHSAVQADGGRARNAGWRAEGTRRGVRESNWPVPSNQCPLSHPQREITEIVGRDAPLAVSLWLRRRPTSAVADDLECAV